MQQSCNDEAISILKICIFYGPIQYKLAFWINYIHCKKICGSSVPEAPPGSQRATHGSQRATHGSLRATCGSSVPEAPGSPTWLTKSHTWLTKSHTWLTMSHTWLAASQTKFFFTVQCIFIVQLAESLSLIHFSDGSGKLWYIFNKLGCIALSIPSLSISPEHKHIFLYF